MIRILIPLFVIVLLSNSLYSNSEESDDKKKKRFGPPPLRMFYEYSPLSDFDTMKYGTNLDLTMFHWLGAKFTSTFKFGHRITDTDYNFPKNIYDLAYSLEVRSKKIWFIGNVFSISDKPFNSFDEMDFNVIAAYNILNKQNEFLFFGLMFPSFDASWYNKYIPFPIISYQYFTKDLTLILPIPTIIRWQFDPKWIFNLRYIVTKFHLSLLYRPIKEIRIGPETTFVQEQIYLANRPDADQYLYYQEAKAGIRVGYLFVSSFIGYSFWGAKYMAESNFDDQTEKNTFEDGFTFDVKINIFF